MLKETPEDYLKRLVTEAGFVVRHESHLILTVGKEGAPNQPVLFTEPGVLAFLESPKNPPNPWHGRQTPLKASLLVKLVNAGVYVLKASDGTAKVEKNGVVQLVRLNKSVVAAFTKPPKPKHPPKPPRDPSKPRIRRTREQLWRDQLEDPTLTPGARLNIELRLAGEVEKRERKEAIKALGRRPGRPRKTA